MIPLMKDSRMRKANKWNWASFLHLSIGASRSASCPITQNNSTAKQQWVASKIQQPSTALIPQKYISEDEFPTLNKQALKYASLFATMYCCEQFSKPTIKKAD